MRVVMNIMYTPSDHVFRPPAKDFHGSGVRECGPTFTVESVDSLSGSVEYQLVHRAQATQLIERPVEIGVAGGRQAKTGRT
jgi:hypothetical protein